MSEALSAKFVQISSQATWSKKLRTCSHQKVHHMYQFQETEVVSCHAEAVGQVEQKTVAVIGGGVFATNTVLLLGTLTARSFAPFCIRVREPHVSFRCSSSLLTCLTFWVSAFLAGQDFLDWPAQRISATSVSGVLR